MSSSSDARTTLAEKVFTRYAPAALSSATLAACMPMALSTQKADACHMLMGFQPQNRGFL